MNTPVRKHVTLRCETFSTSVAVEGLFSFVRSKVYCQIAVGSKTLATVAAGIWPFSGVRPLMTCHITLSGKLLATYIAWETLFAAVNSCRIRGPILKYISCNKNNCIHPAAYQCACPSAASVVNCIERFCHSNCTSCFGHLAQEAVQEHLVGGSLEVLSIV